MKQGFTLAELLIALAILGVIATFTIPKVLQSQSDGKYKAIAKEAAASVSQAYDAFKLKSQPTAVTNIANLTPYLNYVRVKTSGQIDGYPNNGGPETCANASPCIVLHNGAVLWYETTDSFGGTGTTNANWFNIDPDGTANAASGGAYSVVFLLYYNGRIGTWGQALPNSESDLYPFTADPTNDPTWFSWD